MKQQLGRVCYGVRERVYQPRNPADTVLYQAVSWNLETFLASRRNRGREVPSFVVADLRSYLDCGVLAKGFLRLHCDGCGKDRLLGFSCKTRAFCPSCCGRRMAESVIHLTENVLPYVPIRQWVLSVPHRVRYLLAFDPALVTAVYQVFMRAVFGQLRQRARRLGVAGGRSGAVSWIQRSGNSLNLHVHVHSLVTDGVYVQSAPDAAPSFVPLPAPSDAAVGRVVETVARRIEALLKRRKLGTDAEGGNDPVQESGVSDVYAASILGRVAAGPRAGQRVRTGGDCIEPEDVQGPASRRCATASGYSLRADVAVPARDRQRLARLIGYVARPPLCADRLDGMDDGRLVYRFKTPWRDGTDRIILEPEDFIARLAALVPKPRAHLIRFSGVFAPAAKWRSAIVPAPPATPENPPIPAQQIPEECKNPEPKLANRRRRTYLWADLMRRTFSLDVLVCCYCGGRVRVLAAIFPPTNTHKILECLGLPSRPPPSAPARGVREFNPPLTRSD